MVKNNGVSPQAGPGSRATHEAVPSSPEASIPNAAFDQIARKFSDDMGVVLSGGRLRRNYELEHGNIRSAAVASVDGCHGYTCEFSPWPGQHVAEYDALEELLASAIEARRAATTGAVHESATEGDAQTGGSNG